MYLWKLKIAGVLKIAAFLSLFCLKKMADGCRFGPSRRDKNLSHVEAIVLSIHQHNHISILHTRI